MKKLAVLILLILVGVFVWSIVNRLSADALGMAVGLGFGALAGIPTALLVLAAGRRGRAKDDDDEEEGPRYQQGRLGHSPYGQPHPYQPPVIVLAAPQAAPPQPWGQPQTVDSVGYPVRPALPGPGAPGAQGGRAFKVVGEKEEWIEEW
jgi:hypothetical protein